jgi:hypothetical protein
VAQAEGVCDLEKESLWLKASLIRAGDTGHVPSLKYTFPFALSRRMIVGGSLSRHLKSSARQFVLSGWLTFRRQPHLAVIIRT